MGTRLGWSVYPIYSKRIIMPAISVIVPIYKVEEYLKPCIDSILAQSFTDFELILVDDGSPDQCGVICDSYAKQDDRIIVIHKQNGGLSDARNSGLNIAKGDYISFIDSDDVINSSMLSTLYNNAQFFDADISACRYCRFKDEIPNNTQVDNKSTMVFNTADEIFCDLFSRPSQLLLTSCNKIYKKTCFDNIRFVEMHTWEDVEFATQLVKQKNAVKAVLTYDALYYYRDRNLSMSNTAPLLKIQLRSKEFKNIIYDKFINDDCDKKGMLINFFIDSIIIQAKSQTKEKLSIKTVLVKWVLYGFFTKALTQTQFHRLMHEIISF